MKLMSISALILWFIWFLIWIQPWAAGRQASGYLKKCIFQFWRVDCYILMYPTGSRVPVHTDPIPGRKHYRMNLVLKSASRGGTMFFAQGRRILGGRITFFRSDLIPHGVTTVLSGERWVLSLTMSTQARDPDIEKYMKLHDVIAGATHREVRASDYAQYDDIEEKLIKRFGSAAEVSKACQKYREEHDG